MGLIIGVGLAWMLRWREEREEKIKVDSGWKLVFMPGPTAQNLTSIVRRYIAFQLKERTAQPTYAASQAHLWIKAENGAKSSTHPLFTT
jgi:hypothetical protein